MANLVHFEPIFPQHAIERCSATVAFHQPVPDKFFAGVRSKAAELLAKMALYPAQAQPMMGFHIDMVSNQVTPVQKGNGPVAFGSPDNGNSVTILPNAIVYETSSYVRWKPFIGQFEEFLMPIVSQFVDISSVSVIKLDYFDRFFWSGEWSDIDYSQLLQIDSAMLARRGPEGGKEWHSHTGWFDYLATHRRLFNVNVDVSEMIRAGRDTPAPSVGIMTMAQDQPLSQDPQASPIWADDRTVVSVLEEQHTELHRLLASLITARTADQIGLRPSS